MEDYCKGVKRYGEGCNLISSCTFPNCRTDKDDINFKIETMEEIKKEADRLIELFKCYRHIFCPVKGYYSEVDYPAMKKCALICLDEKIITSQLLNHDDYFRDYNSFLHSVKKYIEQNY